MKFLAYMTKGLQEVCQQEILEKLENPNINLKTEKYIVFSASSSEFEELTGLRTVDDIHILLESDRYDRKPESSQVVESFPRKKLGKAVSSLKSFRPLKDRFSMTLSRYQNSLELKEVENEVSRVLSEETGMEYEEDMHDNLDFRIHVDSELVLYSVRMCRKPLYFRDYWVRGRKGSLKTSIAAGLCFLADLDEGDKVVDNFCGAGTILCEAAFEGAKVFGGDIDREAVSCCRENLSNVSPEASNRIGKMDARSTGQPDSYFDAAISNLPWGKQVDINAVELYSKALEEYGRVLKGNGRVVLLGDHPELAEKHLRKNLPDHKVDSFRLGFLGQTPSVTVAFPKEAELDLKRLAGNS